MKTKRVSSSLLRTSGGQKSSSPIESNSGAVFSDMIKELMMNKGIEGKELGELWKLLPIVEKDLLNQQNRKNLRRYKEIIGNITALTLEKNMQTVNFKKRNKDGEKQKYQIIKTINKKMSAINLILFSKDNAVFQLYCTFAEIRGLILDINK